MANSPDILIVDDESDIRVLIGDILEDEGFATRRVGTAQGALNALTDQPPAMIILDIWLKDSDMDGLDILKRVKKTHPHIPVVIISGHGNIEIAVGAIKQGAFDFIEKPFNIDQLLVVTRRAWEVANLRHENISLRETRNQKGQLPAMVGQSPAFRAMMGQLDKLAQSNARVLLHGPVGSGKMRAAQHIHAHSSRADAPFIRLSCAALSAQMDDTGAFDPTPWAAAQGGVVYLDAIADLSQAAQGYLFRVLTERGFMFQGANDPVDLRLISAHQTADMPVSFRQDLFDRLAVIPLDIPALAQRREDIAPLCGHFLHQLAQTQDLPPRSLTPDALAVLEAQVWPGNLRQLRNTLERALIFGGRDEITAADVSDSGSGEDSAVSLDPSLVGLPLRAAREAFEKAYLAAQIQRFDGNISRTAQFVEMERSALHRKIRALGIAGDDG